MNNGSFIMKVSVKLGIYNIQMLELEKYFLIVSIEAKEEKEMSLLFSGHKPYEEGRPEHKNECYCHSKSLDQWVMVPAMSIS